VHWFHGQYSLSIIIGFITLTILMSLKCISIIVVVPGVPCQILILTPFPVLFSVQFFTIKHSTSYSFGYFPNLQTLIPCRGPHVTFKTLILFATITQRDAIITNGNISVSNIHLSWSSNVNFISVQASCWCNNVEVCKCNIIASQNIDMKYFYYPLMLCLG